MNLADIIVALDSRTKAELIQIQAHVTKLLEKHIEIDQVLFNFILGELGERSIAISRFERGPFGPRWKRGQKVFSDAMNEIMGAGGFDRVQLLAIKKFLANILLDDLRERKKYIGMEDVCFSLEHFRAIFERAFPGYRKSDLGSLIMSRLIPNKIRSGEVDV